MSWYFSELPLVCLGVSVLELDEIHIGQWMVSRPFVVGPLLGWVFGDLWLGAKIGILMELLTIDDLPVGNAIPLNATLGTAVAIIFAAGPRAISPAISLPAGLLAGALFRYVEIGIRTKRVWLTVEAEEEVDAGRQIPFSKLIWRALLWHALGAWAFLYAVIGLFTLPLSWACSDIPSSVQYGFNAALELAPWLGFATLLRALRWRA